MQRWEYLTEILHADIENTGFAESLRDAELRIKNPPKYAVQSTIPRLNYMGEQVYRFKGFWTQGQIHLWRLFVSLIRLYTHNSQALL